MALCINQPTFSSYLHGEGNEHNRLTGTQVNAYDLTFREFICKINCPNASSGSNVETPFRIMQWREEELVRKSDPEQVVLQVEPIGFPLVSVRNASHHVAFDTTYLIVWENVLAVLVRYAQQISSLHC